MKLKKFRERNYKNIGITGFTIACILLIVGVFFYKSFALFEEKKNFNVIRGTIEDPGDLYFAYYVDDVITFEMPTKKSGYTLSSKSNCTNGVTISWEKASWTAIVNYANYEKGTSSKTKCNLYFEKEVTVKDYILSKKVEGQIIEDDETPDHNLRYIGANPNNYVYFNCEDNNNPTESTCEKWRIIGIMNNVIDGEGNKESRIKLIRNESIGRYSWDTSAYEVNNGYGVNEWSEADIMKLLNPGYETESVGGSLYWNRQSGNCYYIGSNGNKACDFSSTGLTSDTKKLIGESVWHTGSNGTEASFNNILTSKFYELERSNNTGKICTSGTYCKDSVERTTTWTGEIGLMYPSDYGYATSGGSTVNRETCLNTVLYSWNGSNVKDCKNNDWLSKSDIQWTITPYASSSNANYVFNVYSTGYVPSGTVYNDLAVSPTLYLKSNVKILNDGSDGSESNPFKLSLD